MYYFDSFENDFKQYVNFKIFDLIVDKCLKYEDLGYECKVYVEVIGDGISNYEIYKYVTGRGGRWEIIDKKAEKDIKGMKEGCEKYGVRYMTEVCGDYWMDAELRKDIEATGKLLWHCRTYMNIFSERK